MTLDQFLGIECFSLKRYTRKNILSKVVLSHISSYESTCPNFENESESHSVMSDSLWPHVLYSPCNSPGQNTGVGCHSLLQRIFPTQGSNPGLLNCRQILYQLSYQGSPRILKWVDFPFFRGLPNPGIEPRSPTLQADSVPAEPPGKSIRCFKYMIYFKDKN